MYQLYPVSPAPGGDAWLFVTPTHAALYEAGFAFVAEDIIKNTQRILGGRPLDLIFLSHSHYDHASGAADIRSAFPGCQIAASAYAARVFSRPGAIVTMREMNDNAAKLMGRYPYQDRMTELSVDRILADGDVIELGDLRFTVWETPGHTKCSLSFFDPEQSLLLASESLGAATGDRDETGGFLVSPPFMTGWESSLRAIARAIAAQPRHILLPHFGVIDAPDTQLYLQSAQRWATAARDMVLSGHRAGASPEELKAQWKALFYTPGIREKQPEAAFDLNLQYIIPAILKEYPDNA